MDGKTVDDRDITISLNPCKDETPGDVLGVSEKGATPQSVTAFITKLRDPDPKARACAARQLGYFGAEAKDALPHIVKRMREEEHDGVSVNLSQALWAVPQLRQMMERPMKDDRDMPQRCAAAALMNMGAETRALVPPEMVQRVKKHNAFLGDISKDMDDPTKPKPK